MEAVTQAVQELSDLTAVIIDWSSEIAAAIERRQRILVLGNGGAWALATHFVAELVGIYGETQPPPSAAVCLQSSAATLTAISNDLDFAVAAAREVEAHGRHGDILLCVSTSGTSANIVKAAETAVNLGIRPFALTGQTPNPLSEVAERVLPVVAADPGTAQELQLIVLHAICDGIVAMRPVAM